MKLLFASDMSFNRFATFPGKEQARLTFEKTAKQFAQADFSIVNQENVMGDKDIYTPIIKSGPNLISSDAFMEYIDILQPTALGLANNHAGDYGEEALRHTIALFHERGYLTLGAGENIKEAYQPLVFEKDGVSVAVIAVCENEFGTASKDTAGSAGYHLGLLTKAIRDVANAEQLPIIYFHGGNEFNPFPSPGKVMLYRHFIDLGAKAVIGMHTHCPQGYEIYNGCPVVYSMGNFFFPKEKTEPKDPAWLYGYMTELSLTKDKISMDIIPYHFEFEYHRILEGKEKESFLNYMEELKAVIADEDLLHQYFDCWSLFFGTRYIPTLQYLPEMMEGSGNADLAKHLRNTLTCEAHNEMVTNAFELMYQCRCEESKHLIPKIKRLQAMESYI